MDTRSLRYVLAIARHQNLTKAAEELHVGQPTLSKFLQSLENELGLKLFQKVGHRFLLTYAGECYTKKASGILLLEEDLLTEMTDIRKQDMGEIRMFFANMRSSYTLPAILPAFTALHPNVRIRILGGNSEENDKRLIEGEIDVAFYSRPGQPHPLIDYISLAQEELLICTARNHPLGKLAKPSSGGRYPSLDLAALKSERVILMQPGQRTRQTVDDLLSERQIRYDNTLSTANIHAIIGMVSAGYGVSFIFDAHVLHRSSNAPIDCYSIEHGQVFRDFVAAVRKGSYLSTHVIDMIELTRRFAWEADSGRTDSATSETGSLSF